MTMGRSEKEKALFLCNQRVYSVRIGRGWRALGYMTDNSMVWFWIGSHAEYDRLLSE